MEREERASIERLIKRLQAQPMLRARIEALLDVAENAAGNLQKADDVEERLLEGVRKLGNELLHAWADGQQNKKNKEAKVSGGIRHCKKNFIGKPVSGR